MKWRFAPLVAALIVFGTAMYLPENIYQSLISSEQEHDVAPYLYLDKLQGILLQEKAVTNNHFLMLYGSSELGSLDEFSPQLYFSSRPTGFETFAVGRGGCQSIVQALNFTALGGNLKDKKLVFLVSPQWFTPGGIDQQYFAENFSELQAYHFVFDNQLSPQLKRQIAVRLLDFQAVQSQPLLRVLLEGIARTDYRHRVQAALARPVGFTYMRIIEKRDVVKSIASVKEGGQSTLQEPSQVTKLSWARLRQFANQQGEQAVTNNPFGVYDAYYDKYMKADVSTLKNSEPTASYTISPEYGDLQLALDVLHEEQAKPLFIIVPMNGYWYDYIGFTKNTRAAYYDKVTKEISNAGFPYVDYSGHEYDKYFLQDTMHLGWKGWANIDEALNAYEHGQIS